MGTKRKDSRQVMVRDVEIAIQDLSRISGIHASTLNARIRAGWNIEAACLASVTDLVRHPTSTAWVQQPAIAKRANQLYNKVKQFVASRSANKRQTSTNVADQMDFDIDQVIEYLTQRKAAAKRK